MILKQIFILLLISTFSICAWSQTIVVNGKESDGNLVWADFTGPVDESSSFTAYTSYRYKTKYDSITYEGNTAIINGFNVTLEMNTDKTWAIMDKVTNELLVHEQGHFNIGIITVREIMKRVSETKFTKSSWQMQMKKIIKDTSQKYNRLTLQYDKETNHSKNVKQQEKWNVFFLENLGK